MGWSTALCLPIPQDTAYVRSQGHGNGGPFPQPLQFDGGNHTPWRMVGEGAYSVALSCWLSVPLLVSITWFLVTLACCRD